MREVYEKHFAFLVTSCTRYIVARSSTAGQLAPSGVAEYLYWQN